MHALVPTRRLGQALVHALGTRPTRSQLRIALAAAARAIRVHKHAVTTTTTTTRRVPVNAAAGPVGPVLRGSRVALGEVEVDVGRLEHVVVDLVEVVDGADEVGADVPLLVEGLEAAPHAHVLVEGVPGLGVLLLVGVDPLLDVDDAGAVVDPVRDVGGLRVHLPHLPDDGDLGDGVAVYDEVGAGVGLLQVEELLDGYGAEGLVCETLFVVSE